MPILGECAAENDRIRGRAGRLAAVPPACRIRAVYPLAASPAYERAIAAVADLLTRARLASVFAGGVARCFHLGVPVTAGSVDAIALMGGEQKNQIVMMATHRGFGAEREEIEASEELDLIPLRFEEIRVHILVASNALYGRMVAEGVTVPVPADAGIPEIRVPRREDFALLLQMSNDVTSLMTLVSAPGFDRAHYNRKLESIGLRDLVIPE